MRWTLSTIRSGVCATLALSAVVAALYATPTVRAQLFTAPTTSAVPNAAPNVVPSTMPEPIYWKQDLFLVPYQWSSAADPAAAQAVWLFVSKDRGANWQRISEARPQVKAFNYRADGEGEYWFAIRTIDRQNRAWPVGPYQPELRVIVDTTMPRIEELRAQSLPTGAIEIAWRCTDINLDPNTVIIESQADALGAWQPIRITSLTAATPASAITAVAGASVGHVLWQPPAGTRLLALRASVRDCAGNSATYQTTIAASAVAAPLSQPLLVPSATTSATTSPTAQLFGAPVTLHTPATTSGWQSTTTAAPVAATPTNQPWQPTAVSRSPFRLSSVAPNPTGDGVTAYGNPLVLTEPEQEPPAATEDRGASNATTEPRFAGPVVSSAPISPAPQQPAATPFHNASFKRLPAPTADTINQLPITQNLVTPVETPTSPASPPGQVKRVGSRTFALEYDLDDAGRWGVSTVELWGTRDGGQTWRVYTRDDDNHSPLVATVDEEGIYGFRIVAASVGATPDVPSAGDAPELWVSVDLQRPMIELVAVESGIGNLSDHLILRWQVADDNLEARPISLYYSSRPAGPWSAVATNLEDTGEYAWRVERHVPARFYLRAEARDTAGNLSAFQTREPIEFSPSAR
jgi:hypothetical protein